MDDRDLNALIRMATEVEQMEQDSGHSFQWAKANASRRSNLMPRLASLGGVAAAACLALMVFVWNRSSQPALVPATPTPRVVVNNSAKIVPAAAVEEGSVLLA